MVISLDTLCPALAPYHTTSTSSNLCVYNTGVDWKLQCFSNECPFNFGGLPLYASGLVPADNCAAKAVSMFQTPGCLKRLQPDPPPKPSPEPSPEPQPSPEPSPEPQPSPGPSPKPPSPQQFSLVIIILALIVVVFFSITNH
jgi:hypothetical protein